MTVQCALSVLIISQVPSRRRERESPLGDAATHVGSLMALRSVCRMHREAENEVCARQSEIRSGPSVTCWVNFGLILRF